jgi:hypothetical protein
LQTNYNREKSHGKIDLHIKKAAPSRAGEADGAGLHTMKHHNHIGLGHRGRQIVVHGMEMQETSSHRHG